MVSVGCSTFHRQGRECALRLSNAGRPLPLAEPLAGAACRDMEALRHAEQNGFVRLDSQNGYFLTRKGKQVAKRWKL